MGLYSDLPASLSGTPRGGLGVLSSPLKFLIWSAGCCHWDHNKSSPTKIVPFFFFKYFFSHFHFLSIIIFFFVPPDGPIWRTFG